MSCRSAGVTCNPWSTRSSGHRKELRTELAHKVNLRYAPDVRFKLDESFARSAHIDALLASPEVKRDLEGDVADDEEGDRS